MLFKINQTDNVFDLNPGLHAIPEFAKLDDPGINTRTPEARDRRIKFVILYSDKKSPLRTQPEKQRREEAAKLAGYLMEGKRLDKNGRIVVAGEVEVVEAAIKKYREIQFDEDEDTLNTLYAQVQEIKDYLKSDKSVPVVVKGKIVLNSKGKEIKKIDPKDLKMAAELGEKLPDLVEAAKKLESTLNIEKPLQIPTYTMADLPTENDEALSTLDSFMMNKGKL